MARRVLSITSPATGAATGPLVTSFTYDPDCRVLQTQQSAGGTVLRTTRSSYTLTGQVATATDANGNVTRYAYDSVERLASVTDPVYNVTSYAYDALNRPSGASWDNAPAQTAPSESSVTFDLGYDADNRRIGHTATDRMRVVKVFTYVDTRSSSASGEIYLAKFLQ